MRGYGDPNNNALGDRCTEEGVHVKGTRLSDPLTHIKDSAMNTLVTVPDKRCQSDVAPRGHPEHAAESSVLLNRAPYARPNGDEALWLRTPTLGCPALAATNPWPPSLKNALARAPVKSI